MDTAGHNISDPCHLLHRAQVFFMCVFTNDPGEKDL